MLHRGAATEIEETHRYIYAGGKLLRETISDGTTTKTLDFNYDNVGMPYSLIYNNGTTTTTYYYITNLQGDVMYLVDSSGNEVSAYDYDPYSKVINATGVQWLRSTPCVTVATITTPKPASTISRAVIMTPRFADSSMRIVMRPPVKVYSGITPLYTVLIVRSYILTLQAKIG